MIIKKFDDFVNESYLKGGRAPLYHFTSLYRLLSILKDDELRTSNPSMQSHGMDKSISLTRSIYYSDRSSGVCFEFDVDRLLRDGYKIYPVDEWAWEDGKPNKSAIKGYNFNKSNFTEVKSGRRGTKHGLDLPKIPILETEFEERIYKNVKNLGNYIISIYLEYTNLDNSTIDNLRLYLDKYPHIKIYKLNDSKELRKNDIKRNFVEVTDKIIDSRKDKIFK